MATFETPKIARAESTLPAAGAFSASAPIACNSFKQIAFQFTYIRGGIGGAVAYKVEYTNDANLGIWKQTCNFSPPAVAAGVDSVVPTQRAQFDYQATGAGRESFMSPVFNISGNFVRISVAEVGAVGTPGECGVEFYLRGDA